MLLFINVCCSGPWNQLAITLNYFLSVSWSHAFHPTWATNPKDFWCHSTSLRPSKILTASKSNFEFKISTIYYITCSCDRIMWTGEDISATVSPTISDHVAARLSSSWLLPRIYVVWPPGKENRFIRRDRLELNKLVYRPLMDVGPKAWVYYRH